MKFFWIILLPVMVLFGAGCRSTSHTHYQPTGNPMVDGPRAIEQGPAKDKVLWQYRMALESMRRGQFDAAKSYLDDALVALGGLQNPDENARKSRRLFSSESRKTFYGEPYERVMAYYYRGILYWMDGEPDNARACFRSAQLQDSDAEKESYANDYLLLEYLDGLATVKLQGDGSDALKRAQKVSRFGQPQAFDPKANVLLFLEFGRGPLKYNAGEYGEKLKFHTGTSPVKSVEVSVGELRVPVGPSDDINYQATTRGGRVMDHVLANKAVFKQTADTVGDATLIAGGVLGVHSNHVRDHSSRENMQIAAGGLLVVGAISKIFASATTPEADIRCWDNLPGYLSFVALRLPAGQHTLQVEYLDAHGRLLPNLTKKVDVTVPTQGQDKVVFVSEQSVPSLKL